MVDRAQPWAAGSRARLRCSGEKGNRQLHQDQHLGAVQCHSRRSGERARAGTHVRQTGVAFRQLEPLSVLHYGTGEQSTEHFDFVDPLTPHYDEEVTAKGERIVTFLLYLNDDYDGGRTEFVNLGIAHKGQCGEGLFFVNALQNGTPDRRTLHAGRPPTRGEKLVVSQFIRNRATF